MQRKCCITDPKSLPNSNSPFLFLVFLALMMIKQCCKIFTNMYWMPFMITDQFICPIAQAMGEDAKTEYFHTPLPKSSWIILNALLTPPKLWYHSVQNHRIREAMGFSALYFLTLLAGVGSICKGQVIPVGEGYIMFYLLILTVKSPQRCFCFF